MRACLMESQGRCVSKPLAAAFGEADVHSRGLPRLLGFPRRLICCCNLALAFSQGHHCLLGRRNGRDLPSDEIFLMKRHGCLCVLGSLVLCLQPRQLPACLSSGLRFWPCQRLLTARAGDRRRRRRRMWEEGCEGHRAAYLSGWCKRGQPQLPLQTHHLPNHFAIYRVHHINVPAAAAARRAEDVRDTPVVHH